jgi:hypothetical protein
MRTIGVALLVLTLPILLGLTPDPETVQGHLATCPVCINPENNPARCEALKAISLRIISDVKEECRGQIPPRKTR